MHARARVVAAVTGFAVAAVGCLSAAPAVAAPPGSPGTSGSKPAQAVLWEPAGVNWQPAGGSPAGAWAPSSVQDAVPGSRSESPSSTTAAGVDAVAAQSFTGTGAGEGLGLQPFYGVESFALSEHVAATVNLATGNLVIRTEDVALNAPGLSVRLDVFRNSRATGAGAAGAGAVLSTGQDVGLKVEASVVTFHGPSGFTARYTASGSGGWAMPAGINADLVKNTDGTWALTYRKTGEKLTFTAGGYLVKDVDRNGVGLTLGYDTSDRLVSVTDGAGRVSAVAYNAAGKLGSVTDPYGRVTGYRYDPNSGALGAIDYPDNSAVRFDTTTSGRVTLLQNPAGGWVKFGYDPTGRVTTITRYLARETTSGAAAVTTFAYPSATTTEQTNPIGGKTTYTLDSLGRVSKVVDPLGKSRSTTWTPNSDIATAVDAMSTSTAPGNTATYTYDQVNNLTAVAAPTGASTRAAYAQGGTCAWCARFPGRNSNWQNSTALRPKPCIWPIGASAFACATPAP